MKILGACIVAVVLGIAVLVITIAHNDKTVEVSGYIYSEIKRKRDAHPELDPTISKALEDGKITWSEWRGIDDEAEKLSKARTAEAEAQTKRELVAAVSYATTTK